MSSTRATLTALLPVGAAVAGATMTARYASAHYPRPFAAAPSLYSRRFSISAAFCTQSTDSSARLAPVTTTAVAAAWPPSTSRVACAAMPGAGAAPFSTSTSRGFRRRVESTRDGDPVTPDGAHSPTVTTETSSHPAPPMDPESEVNMELLNGETHQAGHWGHASTFRGISTATAAARGTPITTGGTPPPTGGTAPPGPFNNDTTYRPPAPSTEDEIMELLNEEIQAEEGGGLGLPAELGPAHLRVKAAGLKREAAELEEQAVRLTEWYGHPVRSQVATMEENAATLRAEAEELELRAQLLREEASFP